MGWGGAGAREFGLTLDTAHNSSETCEHHERVSNAFETSEFGRVNSG